MIDERIIGSTVDRRGFARVDTLPKSIAATMADKYPIIILELVRLLKINLNPASMTRILYILKLLILYSS
jgi:hypothetical protein